MTLFDLAHCAMWPFGYSLLWHFRYHFAALSTHLARDLRVIRYLGGPQWLSNCVYRKGQNCSKQNCRKNKYIKNKLLTLMRP